MKVRLKVTLKKVGMVWRSFCAHVSYKFLLIKSVLKNYFFLVCRKIGEHAFGCLSALYLAGLLTAGYFIQISNAETYIDKNGATLFTAEGAMLGVVISVIFSFSSTLMENINEELPAGFYEHLSKDRMHNSVLWISLFVTAALFSCAILSNHETFIKFYPEVVLKSSFISICAVLWALFLSFHSLRRKIGKYYIIRTVEKICLNDLRKAHKKFSELAFIQSKNPRINVDVKLDDLLATIYAKSGYTTNLTQILDNLFDYHDKLLVSENKGPARGVLTVIHNLLRSYITLRSKSSVALPSAAFLVRVSDSQEFLGFGLENLISRGLIYVKRDNAEGILHVITIFKMLCLSSMKVQMLNHPGYDNPIFSQCLGYFGHLIESIVKEKSIEGMLQSTRALAQIATSLPAERNTSEIYSITDKFKLLAITAFQNNYGIIVQEVVGAYRALITTQLFNRGMPIDLDLDKSFRDLLQIINFQAVYGPSSSIHEELQYAYLFNSIDQAVGYHIEELKKSEMGSREYNSIKHRLMEILEKYYRFIYDIAAAKIKADESICNHLAKSIETITKALLTNLNLWTYDRNSIISQISAYAHLPGWFLAKREKNQMQLGEVFTEVLCKIGIISLTGKATEIAKQCFDTLERYFDRTLKENNLRDALDVLEKMAHLTLLADKFLEPLAGTFIEKIKKLEEDLLNKAAEGIPSDIDREQIIGSYRLLNRLIMFHQNLLRNRLGSPFNISAETLLLHHVDAGDVAAFIKKIWGVDTNDILSQSSSS